MLVAMQRSQQTYPKPKGLKKKAVPFPFILDALAPADPLVKPMFSGHAVYIGEKIVFMLRDSPKLPRDNGLWIVFGESFDAAKDLRAMRKEFPSLRIIELLNGAIKHWMIVPADSPGFEAESLHACELALARDERLGRVPQSRRGKARAR